MARGMSSGIILQNYMAYKIKHNYVVVEIGIETPIIQTGAAGDVEKETLPSVQFRKLTPSSWYSVKQKTRKDLGLSYTAKIKGKDGKYTRVERPARKQSDFCKSERCKKETSCHEFGDEECKQIFDQFWKCGSNTVRETMIKGLVNVRKPKRRVKKDEVENDEPGNEAKKTVERNRSKTYHLKKLGESNHKIVCRKMFCAVLGIGEKYLRRVTSGNPEVVVAAPYRIPSRNKGGRSGLDQEQERNTLVDFFTGVSKAPSHYCRTQTKKIFLDTIFEDNNDVYKAYSKKYSEEGIKPVSKRTFFRYMKENHYSVHRPKKDYCDKCASYDEGNWSQEEYGAHIIRKNEGLKEKEQDKKDVKDGKLKHTIIMTADMQSLLTAPKNDTSAMFYHTKLNIHNVTFRDSITGKVMNYIWTECDGGLDNSNFITIYVDHIKSVRDYAKEHNFQLDTIILYTDGCGYQNRNSGLNSALLTLAVELKIQIIHKYLEVGHTHMEVDNVHSVIESKIKKAKKINLPVDYITIIQTARVKGDPYQIRNDDFLSYDYFLNYDKISTVNSIKPSKLTGRPYVDNIRELKYSTEGKIQFKLEYHDEWSDLPQRYTVQHVQPERLYNERRKITLVKYNHLQELKKTIHKDYHSYYDELPHNQKDPETTEEKKRKHAERKQSEKTKTNEGSEKVFEIQQAPGRVGKGTKRKQGSQQAARKKRKQNEETMTKKSTEKVLEIQEAPGRVGKVMKRKQGSQKADGKKRKQNEETKIHQTRKKAAT